MLPNDARGRCTALCIGRLAASSVHLQKRCVAFARIDTRTCNEAEVALPCRQLRVRRVQTTDRQKSRVVAVAWGRKTIRLTPTGTQNLKPQEKLAIAPQIERHPCPKLRGGTQSLISPMLVRALSQGPLAVVVVAASLRVLDSHETRYLHLVGRIQAGCCDMQDNRYTQGVYCHCRA